MWLHVSFIGKHREEQWAIIGCDYRTVYPSYLKYGLLISHDTQVAILIAIALLLLPHVLPCDAGLLVKAQRKESYVVLRVGLHCGVPSAAYGARWSHAGYVVHAICAYSYAQKSPHVEELYIL